MKIELRKEPGMFKGWHLIVGAIFIVIGGVGWWYIHPVMDKLAEAEQFFALSMCIGSLIFGIVHSLSGVVIK